MKSTNNYLIKFISALCITVFGISGISSQTIDKNNNFQITLFPPIGTNWIKASTMVNDLSINLLLGLSEDETAFSLTGIGNITLNDVEGLQVSGVFNYIGNICEGVTIAGGMNITKRLHSGIQISGIGNVAGNIKGIQISGIANLAKNVKGSQISSIINVGKKVNGVQLAMLVNIAEESQYPIGILNIIKNGRYAVGIQYDETGNVFTSLRTGSNRTYGIIGVGYNNKEISRKISTMVGIGARIGLKHIKINNELYIQNIGLSEKSTIKVGYAVLPTVSLFKFLEFFAGVSVNYIYSNRQNSEKIFTKRYLWKDFSSERKKQINIGYQAGIQYVF